MTAIDECTNCSSNKKFLVYAIFKPLKAGKSLETLLDIRLIGITPVTQKQKARVAGIIIITEMSSWPKGWISKRTSQM
jgi:hypothetical protein